MKFNLLIIISICFFTLNISAQNWQNLGTAQFSAGAIEYLSSTMNSQGTPYVAYQDLANSSKTTVMKYDGTNWVSVGNGGFSQGTATWQSVAIDNSGTPYVAYQDLANNSKTTVMKFGGISWVVVGAVGFSAASAQHQSLAIDDNGVPYVAYTEGVFVKCMKFDGTNWVDVGSSVSTSSAEYPSLVIKNGQPVVAYQDDANASKATVMEYNGSTWTTVGSPAFSLGLADYMDLTVDSLGEMYIAYGDAANGDKASVLKYNGTSWGYIGTAGFSTGRASSMSITIDNGTPYIAYSNIDNSYSTEVMKFNGSTWTVVGNATTVANGWCFAHSLEVFNGVLYLSYRDANKSSVITYNTYLQTNKLSKVDKSDFSVYPNPVNDVLSIEMEATINGLNIININGQIVQSTFDNRKIVSVAELPKGIYLIRILTDKGILAKCFVKK